MAARTRRDEGRKERPVCVILAVKGAGNLTHLALLAVSSQRER